MPAKISRSTPRPSFVLPKVTVAIQPRFCLVGRREKREYSSYIGSHPRNLGITTEFTKTGSINEPGRK